MLLLKHLPGGQGGGVDGVGGGVAWGREGGGAAGAEGVWAHRVLGSVGGGSGEGGGGGGGGGGGVGGGGGGGGEGGGGLGTHWKPLNTSKTLAKTARKYFQNTCKGDQGR